MSDTSGTSDNVTRLNIPGGITRHLSVPEGSDFGDEPETNNKSGDLQSHAGFTVGQSKHGTPVPLSPPSSVLSISSDSNREVELIPLGQTSNEFVTSHKVPQPDTSDNLPKPRDRSEQVQNHKLNTLSLAPAVLSPDEPRIATNQSVADGPPSGSQSNVSRFLDAMKSYPTVPSGRNYIHLEHPSDALAFVAYMALQARRIMCLIPYELLNTYTELLKSITDANVHCITTSHQYQSICATLGALPNPTLCHLVLIPTLMLNLISSTGIYPDCVLHWGQPSNAYNWTHQALKPLSPTVKVCVMVVGPYYFNGSEYGVAPYPNAVLATCHGLSSPFQLLRQISSQLLPTPRAPAPIGPQGLKPRLNLHPSKPSIPGPITSSTTGRETYIDAFSANEPLGNTSKVASSTTAANESLLKDMKSCPTIPSGRNYIHLDQASDAVAYIAYMALQFNRVVCVVPTQHFGTCADLLKSLTNANIHRVVKPGQSGKASTTTSSPSPAPDGIFLTPCDNFLPAWGRLEESNPDCILHWSQPASVYSITTRRMVDSFPRIIRACVMVVGEISFDRTVHGVQPYPSPVLTKCFQPDSPLQILRQKASQLLPAPPIQSALGTQVPKRAITSFPSEPSNSRTTHNPIYATGTSVSLPIGHYYIVLDQANDIDILSITSYIAMKSKKVICHIPGDRDLTVYHKTMSQIANVNVIAPTVLKGKPFETTLKNFKSQNSGVWVRTISSEWNSFWSKSLVDCVIYWGIPLDLTYYLKECKLKVNTSYLVLSASQYRSIQPQLNTRTWIRPHPHIPVSATRPGTLFDDLRQKLMMLL
ncbi:hypothetical protein ACGC1H_002428 [Rhizoctonia solani]